MSDDALVGVLADSHVGEFLTCLPDGVADALAGVDVILHAGDLSVPSVMDDLSAIAPVVAVHGDHDRLGGLELPGSAVLTIGGRRIGLTHGCRARLIDGAIVAAGVVAGRDTGWRAGLERALLRRIGPVDCLVYGHWHEPRKRWVGSTLCFSPGAVCPYGSVEGGVPPARGLAGVADRGVRRYRWQLGAEAMTPRVGLIEVGPGHLRARSVPIGPTPASLVVEAASR